MKGWEKDPKKGLRKKNAKKLSWFLSIHTLKKKKRKKRETVHS